MDLVSIVIDSKMSRLFIRLFAELLNDTMQRTSSVFLFLEATAVLFTVAIKPQRTLGHLDFFNLRQNFLLNNSYTHAAESLL